MTFRSAYLQECDFRGLTHQSTHPEDLDQKMQAGPVVAYLGFDATAKSLHVGNLVQIMRLRWLQKTGHKPIVLMGGGTTLVGDPSGKDEMRQMLTPEIIQTNIDSLKRIFSKYLTFGDGPTDALMVNNADWLLDLNYVQFLRDYGRHFSINRMMSFDSVKLRLEREQPLSFLEFNYMILQAYDFLALNRSHDVTLQLGGADQWGNIVSGVDLIRRVESKDSYGLTSPLLTTSSGAKMGKTAQGAVWLDESLLSPFDFWQYWRNTEDADVGRFLRIFTELSHDDIRRLETLQGAHINEAKKILANEVTRLCHGDAAVEAALQTAQDLFEGGTHSADALAQLPSMTVDATTLQAGLPLVDALVQVGLAESKGDARRLVRGGGARVNDAAVTDEALALTPLHMTPEGYIKLSSGKKRHALVKQL